VVSYVDAVRSLATAWINLPRPKSENRDRLDPQAPAVARRDLLRTLPCLPPHWLWHGLGWRDTCFRGRPDLRPTYSHRPGKRNVAAVFALNILLGWSLLGASGPALRVRRGEI
jgi:hypothetical protein